MATFGDLIAAAVLVPETELRRWFSWLWYWSDSLVDDLIGQGRAAQDRWPCHRGQPEPATRGAAAPRDIPESCLK